MVSIRLTIYFPIIISDTIQLPFKSNLALSVIIVDTYIPKKCLTLGLCLEYEGSFLP